MQKIIFVGGARPNFMKLAPILREIRRGFAQTIHPILVHTGQHYDQAMSGNFFKDLELPEPDYNLGVGSGSHATQTAAIMRGFEPVCLAEKPDMVAVVGDVNSTAACALTAAKLQVAVAHVEAGLRSGDRRMPEEINRIVTDALADVCFVTEESGIDNLLREGKRPEHLHLVGNLMIDSLVHQLRLLPSDTARHEGPYAVVTLHRPSNVDHAERLEAIVNALVALARTLPVIFPVHPRTSARLAEFGLRDALASSKVRCLPPMGYAEFLALWKDASLVLTDSGGIQEETTFLGVPCLTLRENTERPITLSMGTNRLVPGGTRSILEAAQQSLSQRGDVVRRPPLWDGRAAERIVRHLCASGTIADSVPARS
ncbi:non-hydrolyzing UDP-N-acetylglucosamine 2-epimerase [Desulfolutivibrio sulfoxidireducens]|uniref:non-hydrolyzing UDP-N-acetylglucosamine 2-epimerase n=1 Tax=Desulfolutivibrio sulfoxidireducens TaxID=2773299 RepID=UPI00159D13E0|nr:UDP-N-acetylglucosamine 2-epimerase (non-hydrolyzing) [Desulfolutivibrio sulfoxidireducens]QLA16085.1 UDP-N-acetylglucosamine 2-epimerase (non-hydrolyzing) [Desulfolutivibrio sulfoxidireducens]